MWQVEGYSRPLGAVQGFRSTLGSEANAVGRWRTTARWWDAKRYAKLVKTGKVILKQEIGAMTVAFEGSQIATETMAPKSAG